MRGIVERQYVYRGRPVAISETAEIASNMRPGGRFSSLVQEVIGEMEWVPGGPIETVRFGDENVLPAAVVVHRNVRRIWAVHSGHKARHPQRSPFVVQNVNSSQIGCVTVELVGSPDNPRLVRVYGGGYTPPLPWMSSARHADGGVDACKEYWRAHAYLLESYSLIRRGSIRYTDVPHWYNAITR